VVQSHNPEKAIVSTVMIRKARQPCRWIPQTLAVLLGIFLPTCAFFFRRIPPLEQELGCSPTLSKVLLVKESYFFDPLSFATDENFARLREAELKHGRVAMLATIGMIVPEFSQKNTAIQILESLQPSQYLEILGTCAFLEAFVFVQQDDKDLPGMSIDMHYVRYLLLATLYFSIETL
jgi:hypothetical protein